MLRGCGGRSRWEVFLILHRSLPPLREVLPRNGSVEAMVAQSWPRTAEALRHRSGRVAGKGKTPANMKTASKNVLGWGAALTLVAGLASASFAGPGPQWPRTNKHAGDAAKTTPVTVAPVDKIAAADAMACPSCKTTRVEQFSALNASGKLAPHYTTVGSKHECAACGGAVTTVRGQVASDMKGNCPVCAKGKVATAVCCNATS